MDLRRRIKKTCKWLAIASAVGLVFLVVLFGLVQTEWGKARISAFITAALSNATGGRIEIGKITGFIPFQVRMDQITVSDVGGQWLALDRVFWNWSPVSLVEGRLHIREIGAGQISLERLPQGETGGEASTIVSLNRLILLQRLQVDHFGIEQFELGKALLGDPARLRVEGEIMSPGPAGLHNTAIILERTDGSKCRLVLSAALKGEEPRLDLEVQVEEAPGGLLAKALGIPGPLSLALNGEGPVQAWQGRVDAEIGRTGVFQSELDLEANEDLKLIARGMLMIDPARVPKEISVWLDRDTRFDLSARLTRKILSVQDLTLASGDKTLHLSGTLDLKQQRSEGGFNLQIRDLSPLGGLTGLKTAGPLKMEGTFSGPFLQPKATLNAELSGLEADKIQVARLEANLGVEFRNQIGRRFPGLSLNGNGTMEAVAFQGSGPFPEKHLKWTMAAEWPDRDTIRVQHVQLTGDKLAAALSGLVDIAGAKGTLDASLDMRDVQDFSRLFGVDLPAGVRLKAEAEGDIQSNSLSARVHGKVNIPEHIYPFAATVIDKEIGYSGNIVLTGTDRLSVSDLRIESSTAKLTAHAALNTKNERLEGAWQLLMPQLAMISPALGHDIGGSLALDGTFKGSPTALSVNAEARAVDLLLEGIGFQEMTANIQANMGRPKSRGNLSIEFLRAGQKLMGTTDFVLKDRDLTFSQLTAKGLQSEVKGWFSLNLDSVLGRGEITGKCDDLFVLSSLSSEKIHGNAKIKAQFEVTEPGQQRIIFDLEAENLSSRFGRAAKLGLAGNVTQAFTSPQGTAKMALKDLQLEELVLASLVITAQGSPEQLTFTAGALGHYKQDLKMETSGVLAALPEGQSVEFNRLYAQYGDLPLELVDPLLIKRTESELVFNKSIFRLGMGRLEGSGRFEKRAVALDLTFEGFPLTALAVTGMPDITGAATGRVSFLGPWARPEGSLELRIDRLGVQYPQLNELPPKTLRARAELKQGRLQTEITVQGLKTKQFDAQLGIPVVFSLSPFACSLPPQGELDGSLSGSMDLAWITLLIGPDDQKVEGQLGGTLFLKGTLADPNITGGMQVEKGVYENVPSGTVLRNIGLEVKANGRRLILDRASASDGEKGTVSANGWLDIIPGQGYPLGVELDLEQVMLLRQDHATASVQGKLKFSGSLAQPVLTGELQVGPAGLHIPEELSPEISGLDVVEVNRVGQETPPPQPVQTAGGHVLKLDVLLRGTDRVLLSGRGIESEWKGDLRVGGWADEPVITGNLSAVRGRLKFLGKRFVLSRGLINFDGATPPSPYMDMLAEARAADIIARVHISGPMLDPKVELSSEPSLPSDEIFSRILFGRSVSEIKPLQAVQLAQATNMMAGGGGLDFIGQMQSFLGIDQLEVKQKEEEDIAKSTVSAGKYLSDTVYIEVERGIEAETGKATVEVELTPNISIETEVGVNATGGAGLNWKWDY